MEKDYHNHIKGVHSTDLYMDKDSYNPLKEYRPTHGQILLYSYKGSTHLVQTYTWIKIAVLL
jgi:hypothetical protein